MRVFAQTVTFISCVGNSVRSRQRNGCTRGSSKCKKQAQFHSRRIAKLTKAVHPNCEIMEWGALLPLPCVVAKGVGFDYICCQSLTMIATFNHYELYSTIIMSCDYTCVIIYTTVHLLKFIGYWVTMVFLVCGFLLTFLWEAQQSPLVVQPMQGTHCLSLVSTLFWFAIDLHVGTTLHSFLYFIENISNLLCDCSWQPFVWCCWALIESMLQGCNT